MTRSDMAEKSDHGTSGTRAGPGLFSAPIAGASKRIALIGAGNIGSRHLQGLTLARLPLDIQVVERNSAASALSKDRFMDAVAANNARHITCEWHQEIADLPRELDVAIVATGAAQRRNVIEALLAHARVRFLVLEKFLFQSRDDYARISELLEAKGVVASVNTPRRCWPSYQELLGRIPGDVPVSLKVEIAPPNGLATNAIHMVDLLGFLTRDRFGFEFKGDDLFFAQKGSRHSGTVEFDGLLKGHSARGDAFSMKAPARSDHAPIVIEAGNLVYHIDEANQKMTVTKGTRVLETVRFPIVYQSQLSGSFVEQLLLEGCCSLPDYAVSTLYHLACIDAFSSAEFRLTGRREEICRIT